jgi:hypothetical protein
VPLVSGRSGWSLAVGYFLDRTPGNGCLLFHDVELLDAKIAQCRMAGDLGHDGPILICVAGSVILEEENAAWVGWWH